MKDKIVVKGARVHNLKNVSLEIPRDKLIVFTGLSGSGKSSLAFDTLYAEGQRRYVESLSSYARQFLGQMNKPDVDNIEGLSPAISIDQKTTSKNPRSTVGTITEIYDYLRLLYARVGIPHCPKCGKEITQQSVDQIVDNVMKLGERTKVQVLAPVIRGKKGMHEKVLENIRKQGFVRVRIDGEIYEIAEEEISLEKNIKHNIEAVVDRLVIKEGIESRLAESIETALKMAEGLVIINVVGQEDILFSEHFACPDCGISIDELAPRLFSFNSPWGKCEKCDGLGTLMEFDPDLIIPDKSLSIMEGAIATWGEGRLKEDSWTFAILKALSAEYDLDLNKPIKEFSKEELDLLLYGTQGKTLNVKYKKDGSLNTYRYAYDGEINTLDRRYRETNSDVIKAEIEQYMSDSYCPKCKGARLKKEALAVAVGGINIYDFTKMSIKDELEFGEPVDPDNPNCYDYDTYEVIKNGMLYANIFYGNSPSFTESHPGVFDANEDLFGNRIHWYVPREKDIVALEKYIGMNHKALFKGQQSGFDAQFAGYIGRHDVFSGKKIKETLHYNGRYCFITSKEVAKNSGQALILAPNYTLQRKKIQKTDDNMYPVRAYRSSYFKYKQILNINKK